MATTRAGVGHMEEQQGIYRHLIAIGHLGGLLDAVDGDMVRLKAEVQRATQDPARVDSRYQDGEDDGRTTA